MWFLLGTTVTASFFDSLNPSAIAQQMLLQAMVKKKQHIWLFILGIGLANLLMGLTIYYGIAAWVSACIARLVQAYPVCVYGFAAVAGSILLATGLRLIRKTGRSAGGGAANAQAGTNAAQAPAQLAPFSLFIMGASFCLVELTSALPYFGFLALLASYHLIFPLVLLFMMLYDLVYILPLILLYFGYNSLQGTAVVNKLEKALAKVSSYIVPAAVSLAGGALACYGLATLLG